MSWSLLSFLVHTTIIVILNHLKVIHYNYRLYGWCSILLIHNVYTVLYSEVQYKCTLNSNMAAASLWASAL